MSSADNKKHLTGLGSFGLIAGLAGMGISIALAFMGSGKEQFFQSYLMNFIFWMGPCMGSLSLLLIHHMTGGAWGFQCQRIFEASSRTWWLLFALFLPIIIFGMDIFPWLDPKNPVVEMKAAKYLNFEFFTVRYVIYALVIGALVYVLNKWSLQADAAKSREEAAKYAVKLRRMGPKGMCVWALVLTGIAVDWGMSLEPEWFSTIYGPLYFVSQVLLTLAFSLLILHKVKDAPVLRDKFSNEYVHHTASLMLGFVILWAYVQFMQYLIIWSGNLYEEIGWFTNRRGGGFTEISIALMIGHFAMPFLYLLNRPLKTGSPLLLMCCWILCMRIVDVYWVVKPSFARFADHPSAMPALTDITLFVGLGGIWLFFFVRELNKRPLMPSGDPRLDDAFVAHHDHEEAPEHA
jgi:hypothetical protein